jgi:hypothetical protein
MRQSLLLLVVLLAAMNAAEAADAIAPRSAQGPYEFDCEGPEGGMSTWSGPLPGARATIGGTIKLVRALAHKVYTPAGTILLSEGKLDSEVALAFVAYPQKPGRIDVQVAIGTGEKSQPRYVAVTSLAAEPKARFTLRFREGMLQVDVGGVTKEVPLPNLKPTRMALSCSTGEFLFEDVMVAAE